MYVDKYIRVYSHYSKCMQRTEVSAREDEQVKK